MPVEHFRIAVGDVAVHLGELRMVGDVEELGAEFQLVALLHDGVFHQAEVDVIDAGSAAHRARRVADNAHVWVGCWNDRPD